ncbi:MAG: replication initiation factor domain-containing protein [Leptospira sp.]|nr:replication initiation factor domain-containing protein [Leptospira sp.]
MDLPAPYLKTPFVDWLSFSIEYGPKSFSWIESVFGKGESLEKGFNGYTHSILTPIGAVVGYSPETPSQKIHLSISSKALFNLNGFITLKELIRQVISNKGKFSRIDLSQDDYDGFLNLDLILEKLKNMEVTSRFRGFLKMEQHNPGFLEYELGSLFRDPKKQKTGRTIYIGDWHSDNF